MRARVTRPLKSYSSITADAMATSAACLEPHLLRLSDLVPSPVGSPAHRLEARETAFQKTSWTPPAHLVTSPPAMHTGSSLRRAAAQCTAALLTEVDASNPTSNCLALVQPIRSGPAAQRERHWDEYDVRIDVAVPRALSRGVDSPIQLINPSVSCRNGRLLLAARAMWSVSVQPPCTDVWRSHALLTSVAFDARSHTMVLAANESAAARGTRACIADLTAGRRGDVYDSTGDDDGGADGTENHSNGSTSVLDGGGSDGNAQAARCGRLGLPPSVGLGMEDPRLFDVTAAAASTAAAAAAASAAAAPDAAAVGSGVIISFSAPRRQATADCAALSNRRAMSLMPLQPLSAPTPLRWPPASDASDRNWILFQRNGHLFAVFSIEPHLILKVGAHLPQSPSTFSHLLTASHTSSHLLDGASSHPPPGWQGRHL